MKSVGLVAPDRQNFGRGIGFYVENLLPPLTAQAQKAGIEIRLVTSASPALDLVHYPFFDLFRPTLKIQPNAKTVVTIHDLIPLQYPSVYQPGLIGKINFYLQKRRLLRCHHIITDSQASFERIRNLLRPKDIAVSVIYLAPADHFFKPLSPLTRKKLLRRFKLPPKFVLYVGDINYNKNLPILFAACRLANLHLALAGKSAMDIPHLDTAHPQTAHVATLAKQLRSAPANFSLLGFVSNEELSALYQSCAAYCQPSLAEGFGLAPLEAMACGAVVVCSDIPVLREITANNCLYFDPASPSQLAEKLKLAFHKSPPISQLARTGQIHARNFSWSQTASLTLNVYRRLLNL